MVDKIGMLASASTGINPVTLVTGVKYTASLVKTFNNMTFLYDPNWEYVQGEPSYPIAFFFVKSMTEQMSSDISQKPMLFYNTASDGTDATQGGLLNIIADNIIINLRHTGSRSSFLPTELPSATRSLTSRTCQQSMSSFSTKVRLVLARSAE